MAEIILKNVRKIYDNSYTAVHDFSLKIRDREFVILVGPSGCGKSTTLRMIAGLEEISSGELYIGNTLVNDLPPKDRDIAMVFQNYALYPHMNVYKNMAFALEMRKMPKDEIRRKIMETAKSLDIINLLDRKPKALSGGQRQRVALGRAMVRNPSVFLLDEPLSNLDAKLRTQMRSEIKELHRKLATTFVYVTHDQTEAMTMGDRIVVMKDGYIHQADTPQELYNNPVNTFVAGFIGSPQMNFINCRIIGTPEKIRAEIDGILFDIPKETVERNNLTRAVGENVILGIRPENTFLTDDKKNSIFATIEICELMGDCSYIHMKTGKDSIICKYPHLFAGEKGDIVKVNFDMKKALFFNKDSGFRI
ncbi:MAG: sn-glycerol-3-phosphate ABC transporter ATP-binding protein UgpC [Ruminococcaceae bacterium]|nr:sn-glycerol-3-phosphate ABC transporter ATP-binding protein UgpC [Oscillospiraceae bacterium]